MRNKSVNTILTLVGALAFSVNASAQMPDCDDVVWNAKALEASPNMPDHCLEVVERNGAYYAKLHAKIVRQGPASTTVNYQNADGGWSDNERTHPPRGFVAQVGNEEVRISDLPVGQEVNIYVLDQEYFTIAAMEVEEEVIEEEVIEEEYVYEPEPEPAPRVLPKTAGQANWLALSGLLLVLLSAGLYVRRQL